MPRVAKPKNAMSTPASSFSLTVPASTDTDSTLTASPSASGLLYGHDRLRRSADDPSYAADPHVHLSMIGNYGISGSAAQYARACVAGAVIKQIAYHPSHRLSEMDLPSWLREQRVPTLVGRTRAPSRSRCANTAPSGPRLRPAKRDRARRSGSDRLRSRANTTALVPASRRARFWSRAGRRGADHAGRLRRQTRRVARAGRAGARVTVVPYDATEGTSLASDPTRSSSRRTGRSTDLPQTIATLRGLIGKRPLFGSAWPPIVGAGLRSPDVQAAYGIAGESARAQRARRGSHHAHNHGYARRRANVAARTPSHHDESQRPNDEGSRTERCPSRRAVSSRGLARTVRRAQPIRRMVRRRRRAIVARHDLAPLGRCAGCAGAACLCAPASAQRCNASR